MSKMNIGKMIGFVFKAIKLSFICYLTLLLVGCISSGSKVGGFHQYSSIPKSKLERQAENLIKKEIKKLKELDQIRQDLINRISHELKTPLVLIYGATEFILAQYKEDLDEQAIKLIRIIEKGGVRLKKLIDDLIDVSKIESNILEIKTRKENICSLLQNCLEDMEFFGFYLGDGYASGIILQIS